MEMALQGYYCLHQYKIKTVLQCLTDLNQFYYFKVNLDKTEMKLEYAWYGIICDENLNVESHVNFLQPLIMNM